MKKKQVYVIGHKNPDTDSICATIAYAHLKNALKDAVKTGGENMIQEAIIAQYGNGDVTYVPRRAGQINQETAYVLETFGLTVPPYISDVRTQVKDINYREVKGVNREISLKQAWQIMRSNNAATLGIVDEKSHLEGLITTGDIANSYMAVFDNRILSAANTPYVNILDALKGTMVAGDEKGNVSTGKIAIAAANTELIKKHVEAGDVVILGNRYEAQLCAVENKAACIIVCEGAPISRTIKKLAEDNGCSIISTPYDTYTVARLINQSMPISYFMQKSDKLITFTPNDIVAEIKGIMTKKRHRDFPIVKKDKSLVGMISRRNLIDMDSKQVILIDHNELVHAVDGLEDAEVLEIIDHHKLGTVETVKPVMVRNQPVGCTSTIIFEMYEENAIEIPRNIAGALCAAIISDTLMFRSPTCTPQDECAAGCLADIAGLDIEDLANAMFSAGSNLKKQSDDQVFNIDFKEFATDKVTFGVGQITFMTKESLEAMRTRMLAYMPQALERKGVDMIFFMLTNIMEESTILLYAGREARGVLAVTFNEEIPEDGIYLPGVVSRKKQLIPRLIATIQQQ